MFTKEDIETSRSYWNRFNIRCCYSVGPAINNILGKLSPDGNNVWVVIEDAPVGCRSEFKISYDLALSVVNDPTVPPIYMGE